MRKRSRIIQFLDKDREERISVWSLSYIKKVTEEQVLQIICHCDVLYTDEERYRLTWLSEQELYDVLIPHLKWKFTTYPN